ncbi:MAG: zinc metallopeptidase [Nevskiaceae bacterium]|jgi:predicted metalloprotease|nr:zinc metallopeptidase [Nevskiaceae bacterium]
MRLDDEQQSRNVEDRRGRRAVGPGKLGLGAVVIALAASYFLGIDPSTVLGIVSQMQGGGGTAASDPAAPPPADDAKARFVAQVLGSTERVWQGEFQQMGRSYVEPKLVLFSDDVDTGCGIGQTVMGPFYCPLDNKVYIDLAFYQELQERFHAPGEFAQAYVIAHEVGHHVQNLLGISGKVQQAQQSAGNEAQANALSVRLELQADCLAGVWAAKADETRNILEAGDVEQALTAASAIGDDRLQQQGQGRVMPDTFTHGTSAQRMRWFKRGIDGGDVNQCDTFAAAQL